MGQHWFDVLARCLQCSGGKCNVLLKNVWALMYISPLYASDSALSGPFKNVFLYIKNGLKLFLCASPKQTGRKQGWTERSDSDLGSPFLGSMTGRYHFHVAIHRATFHFKRTSVIVLQWFPLAIWKSYILKITSAVKCLSPRMFY